jgi:exodeoxyribonuclease V alpha subunit
MQLHLDTDGAIYLHYLWNAEMRTASIVREMALRPLDTRFDESLIENAASDIHELTGIELETMQKDAVLSGLQHPLCVITGGPGTGKTTIIRTIIRAIELASDDFIEPNIALMAPTGRAARRMYEATGYEARTIHSHIGKSNSDSESEDFLDKFDYDYVIVDEASMIDISLAYKLMRMIDTSHTHVIFIGDADQLPPVGPGTFFIDLIRNYNVATVRLKFSFRQSGAIASNANSINNGIGAHAFISDDSFKFQQRTKDTAPDAAIKEYLRLRNMYGAKETVMLSPKKKGACGTVELNNKIQALINPGDSGEPTIKTFDYEFRKGDRVMLTKNGVVSHYSNGDIGTITCITNDYVSVDFDNGDEEDILVSTLKNDFIMAYVSTIHKSQGSEYSGVVIVFTSEHAFMGERALLYTAVTRAKKSCSLIGDSRTINRAIDKVKPILRNSKLSDRINQKEQ